MVCFDRVGKRFSRSLFEPSVYALRDVSFEIREGEMVAVLGSNGAGKTTAFGLMLHLLFPTSGEVQLWGRPITASSLRRVGYAPDEGELFQSFTPRALMRHTLRLRGHVLCDRSQGEWLERFGLQGVADRVVAEFSKGMRQRVNLMQAVVSEPSLLVLDEPMNGLDPMGRVMVRDMMLELKRRGTTVVFSSHLLSDVEVLADRALVLQRGRMAHDVPVAQVLSRATGGYRVLVERGAGRELCPVADMAELRAFVEDLDRGGGRLIAVEPGSLDLTRYFEELKHT